MSKKPTWIVTGVSYDDMKQKSVIVSALSKSEAIEKGLTKIGTKIYIECKLRSV